MKPQLGATLLGLAFDGGRLEAVVLRRTNGSAEVKRALTVPLSLDLLTGEPELVGREIRKHLESAGIRERRCVVCLPLGWALTLPVKLPALPEADLASFLAIEAERGFPFGPEALVVDRSRFATEGGEAHASLVAVSRDHVRRLGEVLRFARLQPVSFSLGIAALQSPERESSAGTIALAVADERVDLQVTVGGGVAALRTLDRTPEAETGVKGLYADVLARETRITLGQLPAGAREEVRRIRIFGREEAVSPLVEQLRPRASQMGLQVEAVHRVGAADLALPIQPDGRVSAPLALAARWLAGQKAHLEFLPPRVSAWTQLTARYSSRKLFWAGLSTGTVAAAVALLFLVQQWQLMRWESRWNAMATRVRELDDIQKQRRKYRPWFDESCRSLSILRRLTEAFPEDGAVSAKNVSIREPATVVCSGAARDNQSLLRTLDKLRATQGVSEVRLETLRGRAPMEFTLNFQWTDQGGTR